jgi:hypothetical protein
MTMELQDAAYIPHIKENLLLWHTKIRHTDPKNPPMDPTLSQFRSSRGLLGCDAVNTSNFAIQFSSHLPTQVL